MAEWKEGKYSFSYLSLSKNIRGSVGWGTDKGSKNWTANFMGSDLGMFETQDEAKKAVENRARKELEFALKQLPEA